MGIVRSLLKRKESKEDIIKNNHIDSENGEIKLIILTESKNKYLRTYFGLNGIYPEAVCYKIDDVINLLIKERCSVRLVVIEQGLGDLFNISTREDLQNLFGMCDGVYKKAIVFYSKRGMRYDSRMYTSDIVRWETYDGLTNVIQTLLSLNEEYSVTKEAAEYYSDTGDPMKYKGETVIINPELEIQRADSGRNITAILNDLYMSYNEKSEESLPQY